jgi:nitrogen fixation NifU-like protein
MRREELSDTIDKIMQNDNQSLYPKHIVMRAKSPRHFGRMTDCTSAACVKGPCGDEIEFYLLIKENIIREVTFYTEGCIATIACGDVTAQSAVGKSIEEVLTISPQRVTKRVNGLSEDHLHCSILAVSALHRAIGNYLFKK